MKKSLTRIAAAMLTVMLAFPLAAVAQDATPASGSPTVITLPNRIADLSPDGKLIAAYSDNALCVYEVANQAKHVCADLAAKKIRIRPDDIVWSPDSTKIAFAETGFQTLIDGDLWVMNVADGALTDLTDDGYQGALPIFGDNAQKQTTPIYMDVLPTWSPDGNSIAFSRSPIIDGKQAGNELDIIPAGGGAVTTVAKLTPVVMGVLYWGMAWAPDGRSIAYSYIGVDPKDPENGIWTVDLGGGAPKRLLSTDPKLGRPAILSINAAGTTGLIDYIEAAMQSAPPKNVYWLLDLKTGVRSPVEPLAGSPSHAYVSAAVFSPDGTKLLFINRLGEGGDQLATRDLKTGHQETLLTKPVLLFSAVGHGLDWANDGTVMTLTDINTAVLATAPTSPRPAVEPAVPGHAATPVAAGSISNGATVVTNDDAKLRVAPSTDAASAKSVKKGAELLVIGPSTQADGFVWWPVEDPSTETIGWIRAEFINAVS